MQWVTRKGVRLDRSACIWLILTHIDPDAEILLRSEADFQKAVDAGARPFHATVSEDASVRERTTFQQLLGEYRKDHPDKALDLMGEIIRGAETKEPNSIEESEGLRAIAKGMNALSRSDAEMVQRMAPVFDAVYSYCSRRVSDHRGWANADPDWHAEGSVDKITKKNLG